MMNSVEYRFDRALKLQTERYGVFALGIESTGDLASVVSCCKLLYSGCILVPVQCRLQQKNY